MDKERVKEIEKTISCLRNAWYSAPSLRLGQLIWNITPTGRDIFYIRDKETCELLNNFCKNVVTTEGKLKP